MSTQTVIQVRLDQKLKREATEIFDKIGIDMPTAIRMFLKRTVADQGFPFDISKLREEHQKNNVNNVIHVPASPHITVSMDEYVALLMKIPEGKITRFDDILNYFKQKYNIRAEIDLRPAMYKDNKPIPYWRIVSTRGMLSDYGHYFSKELQAKYLEEEGFEIIAVGPNKRSLQVKDYRQYLFDFSSIIDSEA